MWHVKKIAQDLTDFVLINKRTVFGLINSKLPAFWPIHGELCTYLSMSMWRHYDNIGRWVSNLEHDAGLFHFTFLSRCSELFVHTWWQWRRWYIAHVPEILHFDCMRASAGRWSRIIPWIWTISLGVIRWRIIAKCRKSHVSRGLHFVFEHGSEKWLSVDLKSNEISIKIA